MDTTPAFPRWQFASDDLLTRYVVVTDEDMRGWSIHTHHVDGTSDMSPFTQHPAVVDDTGRVFFHDDGPAKVWAAEIDAAALLISLETPTGVLLEVDQWDAMTAWLVESMQDEPAGLVIDLGPNTDIPDDELDDIELITAQLHRLDDGVVMVRRSRRILHTLRFADHSVQGLVLERWHHDAHFDDCTDGYLFSRDLALAAGACVAWVRDAGGVEAADRLGCSFDFADELPGQA
jgi:hypothetical protein